MADVAVKLLKGEASLHGLRPPPIQSIFWDTTEQTDQRGKADLSSEWYQMRTILYFHEFPENSACLYTTKGEAGFLSFCHPETFCIVFTEPKMKSADASSNQ